MRITDYPCKCECGWTGTVWDCEPDIDGDGSLGCPVCLKVVDTRIEGAMNTDSSLLEMIFQGGPKGGADVSDMIIGEGAIEELPRFLVEALRNIIYRLKQSGMWVSGDYDIRLYVPKKYSVEFAYIWVGHFLGSPSETETRRMIRESTILIDNIKARVQEGLSDRYYLVVAKVGTNELVKWDSETNRWLLRAPWALAGYRVKD